MTTDWLCVSTPPLSDRPGFYDLCQCGPIVRVWWDGKAWRGAKWPVRSAWGDKWRGRTSPGDKS